MSDALPLVSIVTPAYNAEAYLEETIQSVLGQDYPRLEYIVVDDGSTDRTPEILRYFADRLTWEKQRNQGQSSAMNKGWSRSAGDILAYLSADDILLPHAVSTSVRYLQQNPDVVQTYCDYNLIDPGSRPFRCVKTPEFNYRDFVVKIICVPGPGAFFRRHILAEEPWDPSFFRYPDLDFSLRLGLRGRFLHIPEVLACYRVHTQSVTMKKASVEDASEAVRIYRKFFDTQSVPGEILQERHKALSMAWILDGRTHVRSGRLVAGFAAFLKAFLLHPGSFLSERTMRFIAFGLLAPFGFRRLHRVKARSAP